MRKLIVLLAFSSLLLHTATAQDKKNIIREGSVLTYGVKSAGKEYDFIVTIKKLSSLDGVVFDWKMTAPVDRTGTITMTNSAYEKSYAWYNFFSGGNLTLDKQTSVFISFMMNLDITLTEAGGSLNEKIKLNAVDGEGESFKVKEKDQDFTYKEDGKDKTVKTVVLQNTAGNKTVRIYNESTDAFIVEMSIGFDINLRSVKF